MLTIVAMVLLALFLFVGITSAISENKKDEDSLEE